MARKLNLLTNSFVSTCFNKGCFPTDLCLLLDWLYAWIIVRFSVVPAYMYHLFLQSNLTAMCRQPFDWTSQPRLTSDWGKLVGTWTIVFPLCSLQLSVESLGSWFSLRPSLFCPIRLKLADGLGSYWQQREDESPCKYAFQCSPEWCENNQEVVSRRSISRVYWKVEIHK